MSERDHANFFACVDPDGMLPVSSRIVDKDSAPRGVVPACTLLFPTRALHYSLLMVCLVLSGGRARAQKPAPGPIPPAKTVAVHSTAKQAESVLASLPIVLTGGSDHVIKHWDATGRLSGLIGTQDDAIRAIALTFGVDKEGKSHPVLVSGGAGGQLKIWDASEQDAANPVPLRNVKAHEGGVTALAIAPNGQIIATGGVDSFIRLWDRSTGQMLAEVQAHDDAVRSLQFTLDGKTLVSGSDDKQIRIWKVGARGIGLDYESTIVAHDGGITGIALAPDGKTVASVSLDGYLKVWEINGGGLLKRMRVTIHGVFTVAFSPDGKSIATGDEEGKIRVWNVKTGAMLLFAGGHERGVSALAWAPGSDILVSGGGDKMLRYWNAVTGHQLASIAAHDGTVQTIVIVP